MKLKPEAYPLLINEACPEIFINDPLRNISEINEEDFQNLYNEYNRKYCFKGLNDELHTIFSSEYFNPIFKPYFFNSLLGIFE